MPLCSNCGKENPGEARFCLACGTAFAPPEPPAEERKVITALFTDIVGSTARAEQLDPEDVRAMLQPYYARLRSELERFGGTVEKFIGDAVVAVFGAPVSHEDDAERAVRAALAIREAIDELNAADEWLDLQVRIGVSTGEALVVLGARPSEGEGMAAGDVLNTAARLQSNAPVNGILVGEETYRATAHAIDYRETGGILAKGKAEPVRAWQALATKEAPARPVAQTPLFGRAEELEEVLRAWERVRSERRPERVVLLGAPGIGKTRLVCEVTDRAADVAAVHWGRCLSYGEGITYWPVIEIVKDAAGILASDDAAAMSQKLGRLLDALPTDDLDELRTMAAALANLLGVPTTPQGTYSATEIGQAELHWGIRRVLELRASERPLVLVFEDLHWAEPTLLELITFLAAASGPILLVASARPELADAHAEFLAGTLALPLDALTDADSEALLEELLGPDALSSATVGSLLANAGGNPLFLEQTVRVIESGGLRDDTDGGALPVPANLHALIASRLDQLRAGDKRVVQHASVVGSVFWTGALAHLDPDVNGDLGARLATLERRDLVRAHDVSTVAGEREYAFKHIVIRDVAYGQLPKGRRARLHLDFAEWMTMLQGTGDEFVELVAHHLEQACRLAREVARSPVPPPVEMAVAALTRAAEKAERREGFREAERFYARALELVDDDRPDTVAELSLNRGRTLVALGHLAPAQELLARVTEQARSLSRRDLRGKALAELGNVAWKQGRGQDGREQLREAETIAEEIEDRPLQIRAIYESAYLRAWLEGAVEDAVASVRRALVLAEEVGDRALQIGGHMRLATIFVNAGNLARAEDHLRACLKLARELGSHRDEGRATCVLAIVRSYRGEPEEAEQLALEALEWLERTGDSHMQIQNLRTLARSALARGDAELAEERLREALPLALEGGGYLVVETYRYLVEVLVRQGRLEEARELMLFAARDVPAQDVYARAALLLTEATVAVAGGEPISATASFTKALQLLEEHELVADLAEARLAFARALRSYGEVTGARMELERARTAFKRINADAVLAEIDEELDELAGGAAGAAPPR